MKPELCGVCNEEVPGDHEQIIKLEDKGFTHYHLKCEGKTPKEPCEDCGKHRLFCSECAEYGF